MGYGSSYRDAGTKIQRSGQPRLNYSTSSKHRKSLIFYSKVTGPDQVPPSFSGERVVQKGQALPRTPSVWTLKDPEVRMDKNGTPRPDKYRQNAQDLDEPGPQNPASGSRRMAIPKPLTLAAQERDIQDVFESSAGGITRAPHDRVDIPPGLC